MQGVRLSSPSVNVLRSNINNKDPRPSAGGFVQIRAFSKINLILEVLRKRPDGYHEIRSVMQSLALHDMVAITIHDSGVTLPLLTKVSKPDLGAGDDCKLRVTCSNPRIPTDDRNLVTRAAKHMMREYGIMQPVSIHLEKRIPEAAGLAGGSSDCAAALLGLNRLFNLNITQAGLMKIGRSLGADVPFCIMACANQSDTNDYFGATALAEGVGEKLIPFPPHPHVWVVLACPDIQVSTGSIFGQYKTHGRTARRDDSKYNAMLQALIHGDLDKIAANFKNDLAQVTIKLYPEIQDIINEMASQGALGTAMSGSGPTVFGYFGNKEQAEKAQAVLQYMTGRAFLTHT